MPFFVTGPDGEKIDIRHSYAGLRSRLNRPWHSKWTMSRINTNWGDTYQTIIHWDSNYYPKDQKLGNDIGHWLHSYYSKKKNQDKKLSEAYTEYFLNKK